jgi:hypothetical protein
MLGVRRLITVALALVLAGVVAEPWLAGAGTGPATIRVIARQIGSATVDVGRSGSSPGDQELSTSLVYNKRVTPKTIGQYEQACTIVRGLSRLCNGTLHLPKGDVMFGGSLKHPALYELAVVGGTGLYDNARGTVTVTRIGTSPTRNLLLIRLVG